MDIIDVSKCRWIGSGRKGTYSEMDNTLFRKDNAHSSGVAIIVIKDMTRSLIERKPINDRLITARFDSKYR